MDFKNQRITKIPGNVMPLADKEKHTKDLTKLTKLELLDLKQRESQLLKKQSIFLERLPDKGQKIKAFYEKILAELDRRSNIDEAAKAFSELNLADKGKEKLENLEWKGTLDSDPLEDVIDSDDEIEMDPIKILADRRMHEKRIKTERLEPSLITEKDLKDIENMLKDEENPTLSKEEDNSKKSLKESDLQNPENNHTSEDSLQDEFMGLDMPVIDSEIVSIDVSEKIQKIKPKLKEIIAKNPSNTIEPHVKYLVEKTEVKAEPLKEKFKPFKTTKSNVHDPEKERQRKQGKNWEVTAATIPPIQHDGVKMISLMDSVNIQMEYLSKLKALHEEQSVLRLAQRAERLKTRQLQLPSEEILKTKASFTTYRGQVEQIEGKLRLKDDDQVHDNYDEPKPSGVTFTTYE